MANYADRMTDMRLADMEAYLTEIYKQASDDLQDRANEYFDSFAKRYEQEYDAYLQGKYTDQQFKMWYYSQVGRGERWQTLKTDMAQKMTQTNQIAAAYVNGKTPEIFALNANFTAYEIEQGTGVAFNLVRESTVRALATGQNFSEFRTLSVNPKRDYNWNQQQIQKALLSGILQGDSITRLAKRYEDVMGANKNAAIRNARTSVTSAQNGGRQHTFNTAQDLGIDIQKEWVATSDSRTRDSHKELDGVVVDNDREFPNGCMYPGDPAGEPSEVYNCRCAMVAVLPRYSKKRTSAINSGNNTAASYAKWVFSKTNDDYYEQTFVEKTNVKGTVSEADSFTYNGVTYFVDGVNVKLRISKREHEVANMYSEVYGYNVIHVPEVCGKYPDVHVPDYLINGVKYDLKEINGNGKTTIFDAVKKKLLQADDFIIDVSNTSLEDSQILEQIEQIFRSSHTRTVRSIDLIKGNEIISRYKRK